MQGSWRRWSCQVSIVIAALIGSSGSFPASAQTTTRAVAKQALPYYAYGFYVRADTKRDLVSEAEAIARPLLVQHRLIPASEMKSWNGSGQLPISFDREIVPDRVAAKMQTRDDDLAFPALALSDLVKLPPKSGQIQRPVTMVLMRIGVRQQRNLTAYAEALRVGRAVAQKLEVPSYSITKPALASPSAISTTGGFMVRSIA